jgi:hypothetical protein
MAQEADFRFPTAITADLHARLTPNKEEVNCGQSYEGRVWDVLFSASVAAQRAGESDRATFKVLLAESHNDRSKLQPTTPNLWMVIGPSDQGEAAITLGFPQDF